MRVLLLLIFSVVWLPSLQAADIFENPQNLKVLPEDISPRELGNTMKGFALATGSRCSTCHVGEERQPLDTYDFASDDKELKGKARVMLKMVSNINATLSKELGEAHVQVTCVTCHHGISKPKTLGMALAEAADKDGIKGMQDEYAKLRDRYYGTHSYDFSEFTLTEFAQTQALGGHPDQAYAILDIVLAENSESFQGHFLYGELALMQGKKELAQGHFEKAIKINPQAAGFVQPRLDQAKQ